MKKKHHIEKALLYLLLKLILETSSDILVNVLYKDPFHEVLSELKKYNAFFLSQMQWYTSFIRLEN